MATVKAEHQDLFRRDQQRLADWPPRFRGEGPFLPTGRRKSPWALYAAAVLAVTLLVSAAGTPWRLASSVREPAARAVPVGAPAQWVPTQVEGVTVTK